MCSNLISKNRSIVPGMHLITYSSTGTDYKVWRKDQYNARSEKLDILYKNFDRSYIIVDSFREGPQFFKNSSILTLRLATVEDERGFMVVTRPSLGTIVEPYHHRMPLVLNIDDARWFLRKKDINKFQFNYSLLEKIA